MKVTSSTLIALLVTTFSSSHAWVLPTGAGAARSFDLLAAASSTAIDELISGTDRGRGLSKDKKKQELVEAELERIERTCTDPQPARSGFVQGSWVVEYTDASAPSNGQLGPFSGIAYQEVDLDTGRYANILRVPPNDWLTATLEATWNEWDGVLLLEDDGKSGDSSATEPEQEDQATAVTIKETEKGKQSIFDGVLDFFAPKNNDNASPSNKEDFGATCWVVTFESITIRLFNFPLITKKFDNVKRIWRTTYVDENTRIVRAGRTGKKDDEMVFYMTRNNEE